MKILVLIDRKNWAYHSIAKGLKKYGTVDFDVLPIKGGKDKIKKVYKKYDRFLVMGWQCFGEVDFLPKRDTLVGIHGHHAWDGGKTTPEKDVEPPRQLMDFLQSFAGVNAVSERLCKLFPFAKYTPNGVDTELFKPPAEYRGISDVVGTTYTSKHDWRKGVTEFIAPACKLVGMKLKAAKANVSLEKMPTYYNSINTYVNASSSEGMSLGILEAISCECPVISTWPCEQHVHRVERTVEAIADALINARLVVWDNATIEKLWSWKVRAKAWSDFLVS